MKRRYTVELCKRKKYANSITLGQRSKKRIIKCINDNINIMKGGLRIGLIKDLMII